MSSEPPPDSDAPPSPPPPEPAPSSSRSYKSHFFEDPPAAPTRATFETIQGIITPPPAAAGPSFHRKAHTTETQATASDPSSGPSRRGAAAIQETSSPGVTTGISPLESVFAAAPSSSTANVHTNVGASINKTTNKASAVMSHEAHYAAVAEYTKREAEKGEKAREKRIRNSMKRVVRLGEDGTALEELSEGEQAIWGSSLGIASEKSKQSGKGKGKKKSERLAERFEAEYAAEKALETTPSLPPPTPRLRHASLLPTATTTAESSGRPRYSSSFEGRRRFSSVSRKREPLPVASPPRPAESSDLPRRHSHAHSQPQTQVPADKDPEDCAFPFDTWFSDLEKRVEKRVAKMEGREQETLVEKRRLCDRRAHPVAPIIVVPRPKKLSSVLLGLRHIDFSRPSWQFGNAGEERIKALIDAEDDNLEIVVEGDDLDGDGDPEIEARIRGLLGIENEKAEDVEAKGAVGVKEEEEAGKGEIDDLDLGISIADAEGDDDLDTNLDEIKRALGIKEFLDEDDDDEDISGASAAAGGDRKGKGRAL